jgi:amino acid adenylation domain-containing protein
LPHLKARSDATREMLRRATAWELGGMLTASIQEQFASQVVRTPEALAVSAATATGPQLTYRELDERSSELAQRLREAGVRPREPVAILLSRSVELIIAILGTLKAGAYYMPLHDAYPLARMQRIMDGAGRPVLLADEVMRRRGLPAARQVMLVEPEAVRGDSAAAPSAAVMSQPDDLAYVIHTSGSEGSPRGVAITHRGALRVAMDPCWDTGAHDRVLMVAPYAFAVSIYEIWVPLLHGGHIVLAPPGPLDLSTLRRMIAEEEITAVHLTAGLFRVVADEAPDCLASVREVLTGGDVISAAAVERVLEKCPDITVRAMYGASEVSCFGTTGTTTAPYRAAGSMPVGAPMDAASVYVLDERMRPLPAGQVGEVYFGGDRLARGYSGQPGLTAARFVASPFGPPGERLYRTGDLARWTPDGMIDFAGRASDQVKIRGFRVELTEVEAAIASHPAVGSTVVVARSVGGGRDAGSEDRQLIAYVVARRDGVDSGELQAHIMELLPDYMVPFAFVVMDALPLTPNGKIDRRALPEPAAAEALSSRIPQTKRQEILCSLFAKALGVPRVGITDSFFDLGGQSLSAMRLIASIDETLGLRLTLEELFDLPTVADLDLHFSDAGQLPGEVPAAGRSAAGYSD